MTRRNLLALAAAPVLAAERKSEYFVQRETTLSSAAEAITVQLAAAAGKNVIVKAVQVYCSTGTLEFWLERDGTAATATALTVGKVNPNAPWVPTATATAYRSSDVGSGTQIGPKQVVTGGSSAVLDMVVTDSILEAAAGAVRNFTVRTGTYTGTVRIAIFWEERTAL